MFTESYPITFSTDKGYASDIHLAASGDYVYLVWKDSIIEDDPLPFKAYFVRSTNGGDTFEEPILLDTIGRANNFKLLALHNYVYLLWDDIGGLFFARSVDYGETFTHPVGIKQHEGSSFQLAAEGNNVYIVWTAYGPDPDETDDLNNVEVFFTMSDDNGVSFQDARNLSNTGVYSQFPAIQAYQESVYVVWQEMTYLGDGLGWSTTLSFIKSEDNARSFKERQEIPNSNSSADLSPLIAIHTDGGKMNDTIYLTWANTRRGEDTRAILLSRSLDGGNTFESSKPIISNDSNIWQRTVTAGPENQVYALWQSFSSDYRDAWISFARSSDKGETFDTPIILSNNTGSESIVRLAATETDGRSMIFILWNNSPINTGDVLGILGSEIFLMISTDGGVTFAPPIELYGDDLHHTFVDGPQISTSGPNVYVAWNRYAENGSDARLVKSSIYGRDIDDATLNALTTQLKIQKINVYAHEEGGERDYHPDDRDLSQFAAGMPVVINGLVMNQNHTAEHFDYITEVFDSEGIAVYLNVRKGVAVPVGREIGIDSGSFAVVLNQTGTYKIKIFAWRYIDDSPLPLSVAASRSVDVVIY